MHCGWFVVVKLLFRHTLASQLGLSSCSRSSVIPCCVAHDDACSGTQIKDDPAPVLIDCVAPDGVVSATKYINPISDITEHVALDGVVVISPCCDHHAESPVSLDDAGGNSAGGDEVIVRCKKTRWSNRLTSQTVTKYPITTEHVSVRGN